MHTVRLFHVSVPFPGILFLNYKQRKGEKLWQQSFRPLSGDLISQFRETPLGRKICDVVSVPFPGILFLNRKKYSYIMIDEFQGFRPLPGDLISQLMGFAKKRIRARFRPLPGDLISQSYPLHA
mgnify:FL=1